MRVVESVNIARCGVRRVASRPRGSDGSLEM